ncbi:MAG: hypothetical protein IPF60_14090 [Betaproteobacteria bacterium]|nr:hypothetical protein [Betaproteobacteria bacterium]
MADDRLVERLPAQQQNDGILRRVEHEFGPFALQDRKFRGADGVFANPYRPAQDEKRRSVARRKSE